MKKLIGYLDLVQSLRPPPGEEAHAISDKPQPSAFVLNLILVLQYAALLAGVFAKKYLDYVNEHSKGPFFSWPVTIVSAIVAAAVFPAVYKKAMAAKADGLPVFAQLCTVFAAGVGYKALIDGGGKLLS